MKKGGGALGDDQTAMSYGQDIGDIGGCHTMVMVMSQISPLYVFRCSGRFSSLPVGFRFTPTHNINAQKDDF